MSFFELRRDHFALFSLLFLICAFLNLLIAMVTGSVDAYRTLPAWFLLLCLTSASSFLKDMKVACWFFTVGLCIGVEFLRYQQYNTEILFRTTVNYAPLTMFILLLLSARTEERTTAKEQAYARLQSLRKESSDKLKQLKKLRSGEMEQALDGQAETIRVRRVIFEIYQEMYPKILRLRYKREIPPILQQAASQSFGLQAGVIFEMPEEKGGEVQVRARWGMEESPKIAEAVANLARSDLVRHSSDGRQPLDPTVIKRQPNLYEEFDTFKEVLFPIETVAPVLVLGKTVFVLVSGRPSSRGRASFEYPLLGPILNGCGLAMSKLAQKDGRASFSTFGA